jgi:hypothetical protein
MPIRFARSRRLVALAFAITGLTVAAPVASAQTLSGRWTLAPTRDDARLQLTLRDSEDWYNNNYSSSPVDPRDLRGLEVSVLRGRSHQPVKFRISHQAGEILFEGEAYDGEARGRYTFVPNKAFFAELQRRGYSEPTEHEQFRLALHDVRMELVEALRAAGYSRPTPGELARFGSHDVSADYVRRMAAAGYSTVEPSELIRMHSHGVTPDLANVYSKVEGRRLEASELVRTMNHGVSPELLKEYRDAGVADASVGEIVRLRDHGVAPSDARDAIRAAGRSLSVSELTRRRVRDRRRD